MRGTLPPLVLAIVLTGCALDPDNSYVAPLNASIDAAVLSAGISDFVATRLPPARTVLVLDPTTDDQASNALTPLLTDSLRRRGYALADAMEAPDGAHRLRYLVTPLDGGDLVRLTFDSGSTEASRFFVRNSAGGLQAGGPFAIRTVEASR